MHRRLTILLVFLALGLSGPSVAQAAVRSYDQLSYDEKAALDESECRVGVYDKELQTLDSKLKHHRISAYDHQWQTQELVSYISEEATYQNQILQQSPSSVDLELPALPESAAKVLRTVGKYTVQISIGALESFLGAESNDSSQVRSTRQ